ncbi:FAD-dependent oxidoreductase [Actinoplanes utahensis]|uniref:FAD-dependent oxidoreductase n=1 Tax=Actinoplanes utahensis TaxID=1869 RepID=UPI000A9B15C9|nr:FAD-binding oxidoreductase [Actinoplanes utahensis]GIF32031.1 hypothetical protein Aut01nite_50170 [Actinoplanes utahensis]
MHSPSFWLDSLGPVQKRPPLPGDLAADVAVAGGGYTGLWTAYYLAKADPGRRIVVLDAEYCGFGASGRDGGWASGLFPVPEARLASTARRCIRPSWSVGWPRRSSASA